MIARLIEGLQRARLDPTPMEVADALWLANHLPASTATSYPSRILSLPDDATAVPEPATRCSGNAEGPAAFRGAPLVPDERGTNGHAENSLSFRAPSVRALANGNDIARSLRPLRRQVAARQGIVYDETATVEKVARLGLDGPWLPVVRRRTERWLELALVVDGAESMSLWGPTIRDLHVLLSSVGIFRDVRLWSLLTSSDEPCLVKGPAYARSTARACRGRNELVDAAGRRAILLVTDCVSRGWRSGAVRSFLADWARQSPLAIVQVLPEDLWSRTALRGSRRVRLTTRPTAAAADPSRPSPASPIERGLRMPVLTLDGRVLHAWSQVVAGVPRSWAPGVLLTEPTRTIHPPAVLTGAGRVERFRRSASPRAQELAELLSAVPLYQPVIRLVAQNLLPDATPGHMAEVFLGGLMKRVTPLDSDVGPDDVSYEFFPGVREELCKCLSSSAGLEILSRVSGFVLARAGQSLDFRALVLDPSAGLTTSAAARTFAVLATPFLRRLGGAFADLAARLEQSPEAQPAAAPATPATAGLATLSETSGSSAWSSAEGGSPGARSATRTPVTAEEDREGGARENGRWILVDGTDDISLTPEHDVLAEHLGAALAKAGFSLLTLGRRGVAHVAARAFVRVLERRGQTSGIHRLVNAVAGGKADFDRGRTFAAEDPASWAVGLADAIVVVGAAREGQALPSANVPWISLSDPVSEEYRPGTGDTKRVDPIELGREAEARSSTLADDLRYRLGVTDARYENLLAPFLELTEAALDRKDLKGYNEVLDEIAEKIEPWTTDAANARFIEEVAPRLLTDPLRVSHRLLGFLLSPHPAPRILRQSLLCERRAVRTFRETRSLWFALRAVGRLKAPDAALGAACLIILGDLESDHRIDPNGECQTLLRSLLRFAPAMQRASQLAALARDYESLRTNLPPGDERTYRMNELIDRVDTLSPAASLEAPTWFDGGSAGQRIVALGLLPRSDKEPETVPVIVKAIRRARSAFEQYIALANAISLSTRLDADERQLVVDAVEAAMSGEDVDIRIDDRDMSRMRLAESILETLDPAWPDESRPAKKGRSRAKSSSSSKPSPGPGDGTPSTGRPAAADPRIVPEALKALCARMGLWVNRQAPKHVVLGDVGVIEKGRFFKQSTLAELSVDPGDTETVATSDIEVTVNARLLDLSAGRARLHFDRVGGAFLRATAVTESRFIDITTLGAKLRGATSWKYRWAVVTRVLTVGQHSVVVAGEANATAEIHWNAGVLREAKGVAFHSVSIQSTPLLFELQRIGGILALTSRLIPVR